MNIENYDYLVFTVGYRNGNNETKFCMMTEGRALSSLCIWLMSLVFLVPWFLGKNVKKNEKCTYYSRDSDFTSMIEVIDQNVLQEKVGLHRPYWGH